MDDLDPIAGYPNKKAMLEALYAEEGLSINQVASRIGTGPATVERWMRLLGVPKRGRGGNNSSAKIGWRLHRCDPRVVLGLPLRDLARLVQASESYVYKARKGWSMTWTFVSSPQPPG
jgi:transposase-like protein